MHFQFNIFNHGISVFVPIIATVIFDIGEYPGIGVDHVTNQNTIHKDLIVIFEIFWILNILNNYKCVFIDR